MQAVLASATAVGTRAGGRRRTLARLTGAFLGITFLCVIAVHAIPGVIAGQRVSGTSDTSAIAAFYGHPSLQLVWSLAAVGSIGLVFFPIAFRSYLRTFELSTAGEVVLDIATATAILEAPLIAIEVGLQSAMVQVVAAGASAGLLALFAGWDWIYNGTTYWFEATWMIMFAAMAIRTRALPSWIGVLGTVAGLGLMFNSQALALHVPDSFTLVPTAFFAAWFVAATVYLVRGGRPE